MYYRRLPRLEYLAPRRVQEACSLLEKYAGNARVTAGGTIVVHNMKERVAVRKYLIGLKAIPDLAHLGFDKQEGLRIGSMVTLQSIADSAVVKERYAILAEACGRLGSPQIRNAGTIGGNICCKFPTAETVPVLISLGAEAKINDSDGERRVAVEDLHIELRRTGLVTEICLPIPAPGARGGYQKYAIRDGIDYATVSAAVVVTSTNGTCKDIKIGLGGVALRSMRAKKAEELLRGKAVTDNQIAGTAQAASKSGKTFCDIYYSAKYKRELLKVMVERAIREALDAG